MNFLRMDLLPWIIVLVSVFIAAILLVEKKFFQWIKTYWFLGKSLTYLVSQFFWIIGIILLAFSLLDPRGPETRIKGRVKQDKTVILMDTSTSMLAEDVRPNRLERAVLLAKHFVRRAVGHHVAILIFSDMTKKLVPFTNDLDLLDARLDSVKSLHNLNAGSSISQAMEEAVQYFDPKDDGVSGNIIVFTDGEENQNWKDIKIPENVTVIFIGVGTYAGGNIPMRDSNGISFGYKKYQGENVVTKINESFFQAASEEIKSSTYIIPRVTEIPTEEILAFLSKQKEEMKEGDNIIRPVEVHWYLIPAILSLITSYLLRFFPAFRIVMFLLLLVPVSVFAEPEELSDEGQQLLQKLKSGEATAEDRFSLAGEFVKSKDFANAEKLYSEQFSGQKDYKANPNEAFNWGTSLLEGKNINKALRVYKKLLNDIQDSNDEQLKELKNKVEENIKKAFAQSQSSSGKNNQKQDKKNQSQSNNKNSDGGEGQGQDKSQGEDDSEENKDQKKNPFDTKNQDEKQDKKNGEGDQEKENKPQEGQQQEKQNQEGEQGNKERKKTKVAPLLQQLKEDDRKLQLKLLDTGTQKRKDGPKKDW